MTSSTKTGLVSIENKTAFCRKYHISKSEKNRKTNQEKTKELPIMKFRGGCEVTVQCNDECPYGSGN